MSAAEAGAGTAEPNNNSKRPAASSSSPAQAPPRRRAVAFGRNYYHALAGTATATTTKDPHRGTRLTAYQWDDPPWSEERSDDNNKSSKCGGSTNAYSDDDVRQVEGTAQSTVFLTKGGRVYQTGTLHGRVLRAPIPVTIPLPLKCVEIAAGRHFCLGRMEGGLAVVSWGAGHFGQLGVGSNTGSTVAADASSPSSSASAGSGSGSPPDSQITFTPHPVIIERLLPHMIGNPIRQVAAGDWHALALTESGRVWAWGSNRSYQCGRKPTLKSSGGGGGGGGGTGQAPTLTAPLPVPLEADVVQISAGRSHSVAVTASGQVFCWGASNHGQCGNVIRRSGVVPPRRVEALGDLAVTQVAAGGNHTLALTGGGRVFAWGSGSEGELGLGTSVSSQVKPRLVGDLDFVAIAAGQEWKSQQKLAVGSAEPAAAAATVVEAAEAAAAAGEPSSSSSSSSSPRPHALSEIPKITKVFAGASYSAALSSSGHLYCWGSNDAHQTGVPVPVSLPLVDNIGPAAASKTSTNRDLHVRTFDSSHNVLLPVRVDAVMSVFVRDVACGPNHMWCVGEERDDEQQTMVVGKTLYEVQEDNRMLKLHRARDSLLSKVHHAQLSDDRATEGTTQTDDNTDPAPQEESFEYSEAGGGAAAAAAAAAGQQSEISSIVMPVTPRTSVHELASASLETPVYQSIGISVERGSTPTTAEPATPASIPPSDTPTSPATTATPTATVTSTATTPAYSGRPIRRLSLLQTFSHQRSRSPNSGRHHHQQQQQQQQQQRRRLSLHSIPRMLRRFSLGSGAASNRPPTNDDTSATPNVAGAAAEQGQEPPPTGGESASVAAAAAAATTSRGNRRGRNKRMSM